MEPKRNGTFAAKPLDESPRNSSHGAILSFLFFLFSGINQCLTVNRIENNSTGSAQVHLAEARGFAPRHYSSSLVIARLFLYFSHFYYFIVAITRKKHIYMMKGKTGIQPFPASGNFINCSEGIRSATFRLLLVLNFIIIFTLIFCHNVAITPGLQTTVSSVVWSACFCCCIWHRLQADFQPVRIPFRQRQNKTNRQIFACSFCLAEH